DSFADIAAGAWPGRWAPTPHGRRCLRTWLHSQGTEEARVNGPARRRAQQVCRRDRRAAMPRIDYPPDSLAEFKRLFNRSRRGNLWRIHEGRTLTVFQRPDGTYAYCIASSGQRARFSRDWYASEAEALEALWQRLER